jgi:hypothetical protein
LTGRKKTGGDGCGTVILLAVAFAVGRWTAPTEAPAPAPTPAVAPLQAFAEQREQSEAAPPAAVEPETPAIVEPEPEPDRFVYYRNCSAARAAGAAPIRTGEPGYAGHLDRDGDGVACE